MPQLPDELKELFRRPTLRDVVDLFLRPPPPDSGRGDLPIVDIFRDLEKYTRPSETFPVPLYLLPGQTHPIYLGHIIDLAIQELGAGRRILQPNGTIKVERDTKNGKTNH